MIAILQGEERLDVRVEDEVGRRNFTADLIRTAIACLEGSACLWIRFLSVWFVEKK